MVLGKTKRSHALAGSLLCAAAFAFACATDDPPSYGGQQPPPGGQPGGQVQNDFAAEVGKTDCRVGTLLHGDAARHCQGFDVRGDVFLRHMSEQSKSRELVELVIQHAFGPRSPKYRRNRAFPKSTLEPRYAAQYFLDYNGLVHIRRPRADAARFGV